MSQPTFSRFSRLAFVIILAPLFIATPAFAQQGQINGLVSDTTAGIVPGVTITATETETGVARTTVSGTDGRYQLPSMRPTLYDISAEIPGFRTFRRTGVQLVANQNLTINITLQIGELEETVTVSGAAASVDITTATISEVVDHERIVELPLNGRDAAKLTTLVAGTVIGSVSTESGKSIPGGLRLSSNGSSDKDVAFRLDGTSNNDPYYQENQTFPFPEALQEFSIQTSNYSAAQGNQAGAVVNAVTKSGTNDFHGGSFGYLRDRTFNSKPFFAPERDFLKRKQYGAFLGGPFKVPGYNGAGKTFFFAGWQGTQIGNRSATANVFIPTDDMLTGNFATCGQACNVVIRDPLTGRPFPGNQIPVDRFDPAVMNIVKQIPRVQGDGLYQIPRTISQDLNQFVLRIDQQIGNKNQITNRYFIDHFDNDPVYTSGNLLTYRSGTLRSRVRTQNNVISWKRTLTPTLLNESHFGYNRVHASRTPPTEGVPTLQSLGVRLPLYPTKPSLQALQFGIGDNLEGAFIRDGFEVNNRTSWMRGKHSVQAGGELQIYRVEIINEYRRGGQYTFTSGNAYTGMNMADIMLGHMSQFIQGTGEYKDNHARYYSAFLQDDYKMTDRLSVNMGVRWEPSPPWREQVGRFSQFRMEDYLAGVQSTRFVNAPPGLLFRGDPGVPYDGTNIDWNNVGVRLGTAWDVTGDGRTSLRGGWGMFYDQQIDGEYYQLGVNSPPWSMTVQYAEPSSPFSDPYRGRPQSEFDAITPAMIGRSDAPFPKPVLSGGYDEKFETPITYNMNLMLEREVLPGWMARAAYVGSRARQGRTSIDLNPAVYVPGATTATTDARRALVPYGTMAIFVQTLWTDYDSMQLTMNRRFSKGWTINSNYTLAKSNGDSVGLIPYNMPQDPDLVEGPANNWRKHRFVASWVYDVPGVGAEGSLVRGVLGGWQLTGIYQYQSGGPLTMLSGSDSSRDGLSGDRAVRVEGVPYEAPAGSDQTIWFNKDAFRAAAVGTFGTERRGAYTGPPLTSWDMGLFKNFRFGDGLGMQFRAEFFNVFNRVNFADPNVTVSSGSFGRITATNLFSGDPRIVQFGLKFVF